MSRLGKIPVAIPDKVKVQVSGETVKVEGPQGNLSLSIPAKISVKVEDNNILVSAKGLGEKSVRAMYGTTRAHLANMVKGVAEGYRKILDIAGVGYNAKVQGKELALVLGFSHSVELPIPEGLKVECPSATQVIVSGADKQQVGEMAARIRAVRPVEPYNLKGVRYREEVVKKKAGKTFVTGGAK